MMNTLMAGASLLLLFLAFINLGTPWAGWLGIAGMAIVLLKMVGDKRAARRQ
jgi:hypothetical protein